VTGVGATLAYMVSGSWVKVCSKVGLGNIINNQMGIIEKSSL
jgi:hypothetical protein